MKNYGIIAFSIAVLLIGGGCTGDKAGLSDAAAVAAADVTARPDVSPDKPYFNPTAGTYEVRLNPASDGGQADPYGDPLDLLGRLGFEVRTYVNMPGEFMMVHNGSTFYAVDGSFSYYYVPEYDGKCSSLAYAFEISGTFVSPTEARGRFVRYVDCRPANWGDFIATLWLEKPKDAGIRDVMKPIDLPAVQPTLGHYTARLVPDGSDASTNSISPLDRAGLTIYFNEATGKIAIQFISNVDTDGKIPIENGKFNFKHGRDNNALDQKSDDLTTCPGNGYHIIGTFVSPIEIHGSVSWIVNCRGQNGGEYIATLDPQPDSGAIPDAALPDAGASDGSSQ